MANNLIQRMQSGGDVVQLEEFKEGQYLEKVVSSRILAQCYKLRYWQEARQ